jgi:hypothetical protein
MLRLDGETHRFLRGHIVIPVVDGPEDEFVWSVWTTLGSESWEQVTKVWDDPAREDLPAMFGWLNSRLPYDQPTLSLRTSVRHRAPGLVPLVEVDPSSGHQLAAEQRDGITWHRVAEINELLLGG